MFVQSAIFSLLINIAIGVPFQFPMIDFVLTDYIIGVGYTTTSIQICLYSLYYAFFTHDYLYYYQAWPPCNRLAAIECNFPYYIGRGLLLGAFHVLCNDVLK